MLAQLTTDARAIEDEWHAYRRLKIHAWEPADYFAALGLEIELHQRCADWIEDWIHRAGGNMFSHTLDMVVGIYDATHS